jgi:hypothetical protein
VSSLDFILVLQKSSKDFSLPIVVLSTVFIPCALKASLVGTVSSFSSKYCFSVPLAKTTELHRTQWIKLILMLSFALVSCLLSWSWPKSKVHELKVLPGGDGGCLMFLCPPTLDHMQLISFWFLAPNPVSCMNHTHGQPCHGLAVPLWPIQANLPTMAHQDDRNLSGTSAVTFCFQRGYNKY